MIFAKVLTMALINKNSIVALIAVVIIRYGIIISLMINPIIEIQINLMEYFFILSWSTEIPNLQICIQNGIGSYCTIEKSENANYLFIERVEFL